MCNMHEVGRCRSHLLLLSFSKIYLGAVALDTPWAGIERTLSNMQDFMGGWLPLGTKNYNLKVFTFSIVLWVL